MQVQFFRHRDDRHPAYPDASHPCLPSVASVRDLHRADDRDRSLRDQAFTAADRLNSRLILSTATPKAATGIGLAKW